VHELSELVGWRLECIVMADQALLICELAQDVEAGGDLDLGLHVLELADGYVASTGGLESGDNDLSWLSDQVGRAGVHLGPELVSHQSTD